MKKSHKNAIEILETLTEFVYTSDFNLDTAPIEIIEQALKNEGVNANDVAERIRKNFIDKLGQAEIASARKKRIKMEKEIERQGTQLGLSLRERIISYINELKSSKPEQAQIYFRKLDAANEEDMESLLEDIAMLDEMDDEDEK